MVFVVLWSFIGSVRPYLTRMSNIDDVAYIQLIDRVRRNTRMSDVIDLCNEALARQMELRRSPETTATTEKPASEPALEKAAYRTADGKFDKKAYQRDLMRQRRARSKVICESENADVT